MPFFTKHPAFENQPITQQTIQKHENLREFTQTNCENLRENAEINYEETGKTNKFAIKSVSRTHKDIELFELARMPIFPEKSVYLHQ